MRSPVTFPLNFCVKLLPATLRVTLKELLSPSTLPPMIGVAAPSCVVPATSSVPVSASPSSFRFRVHLCLGAPFGAGASHVHVPLGSIFSPARARQRRHKAAAIGNL